MAYSHIRELIRHSPDGQGLAVFVVLSWLAMADEQLTEGEVDLLLSVASASPTLASFTGEQIAAIIGDVDRDDLEVACSALRAQANTAAAVHFLGLAVSLAVSDGYLTSGENLILRFLADLLEVEPSEFRDLFEDVTGKDLPETGDPSSLEWWRDREGRARSGRGSEASGARSQRVQALAVLGLEETASAEEVKSAYRRLARIHHPDQFERLGAEAVEMAKLTFQRINEAYEVLSA